MTAMTLAQARTRVLKDYLDDQDADTASANNGSRWNDDGTYGIVDRHLKSALSQCLVDYSTNGGDAFDTEVATLTTSSTTGTVSVATQDPLLVKGISVIVNDTVRVKLLAASNRDSSVADLVERDLAMLYVPKLALPTTSSHPLVGSGSTAANTWDAFDDWICARAAVMARMIEGEPLGTLETVEAMLRSSVLTRSSSPRARQAPKRQMHNLRWQFLSNTIRLVRV